MRRVGIIGGGPSGLAAANALHRAGADFELFDQGPPLQARHHDRAHYLGVGIGGGGLFSDGKFSFFPSGTYLYQLENNDRLKTAFAAICNLLSDVGIRAPAFPSNPVQLITDTGDFAHKTYLSQYGSLEQRIRLIELLAGDIDATRIHTRHHVTKIEHTNGKYRLFWDAEKPIKSNGTFTDLVIATGRFGGHDLRYSVASQLIPIDHLRYELGIRIEHPNHYGFLHNLDHADVKFIMCDGGTEIRTFCTCRHGEVCLVPYTSMSALSGRSEARTAYSNFGLLPRFSGATLSEGHEIWEHFLSTFGPSRTAIWQPLPDFLNETPPVPKQAYSIADRPWRPQSHFAPGDISRSVHPRLRKALHAGISTILDQYPEMNTADTICLFPAVEGVGAYPACDRTLRVANENIWCSGDVVGKFRGLIPALVSGQYTAMAILQETT